MKRAKCWAKKCLEPVVFEWLDFQEEEVVGHLCLKHGEEWKPFFATEYIEVMPKEQR